jgi:DNA-binding transcriptional LysR family regulator
MDLLESMKVYVLAVEKGSLSAAALEAGISPTMAGNHLRMLEARLGMQLLQRTTRRQRLTEFGEEYYGRCKEILRLVQETEVQAQNSRLTPTGTLRITAPVSFGTEALMPCLPDYLARYPEVSVDVVLADRVTDLLEEGFEAAIRVGQPALDTNLVARPLAPYRSVLCAAPAYLARRGTPRRPEDLAEHDCLSFSHVNAPYWRFERGGETARVAVTGRLRVNHGQALRVAALHGLGIVQQPAVLLETDLAAGRLVRLLPAYESPSRPLHLMYRPERYRSLKLRSFIDFVMERFGEQAGAESSRSVVNLSKSLHQPDLSVK